MEGKLKQKKKREWGIGNDERKTMARLCKKRTQRIEEQVTYARTTTAAARAKRDAPAPARTRAPELARVEVAADASAAEDARALTIEVCASLSLLEVVVGAAVGTDETASIVEDDATDVTDETADEMTDETTDEVWVTAVV